MVVSKFNAHNATYDPGGDTWVQLNLRNILGEPVTAVIVEDPLCS